VYFAIADYVEYMIASHHEDIAVQIVLAPLLRHLPKLSEDILCHILSLVLMLKQLHGEQLHTWIESVEKTLKIIHTLLIIVISTRKVINLNSATL